MSVAEHQVLVDRYEIEAELGRGGMAHVYRARDRLLGRTVALKVLPGWLASDPAYVERFRREARAAARLSHPNVVNVYDTGSDAGVHFIVMEFVDGRPLSELLSAQGALQPEAAAGLGSQVAAALAAAHAGGLVHRDVKPANIMLTADGDAKVTDFGIARAVSSQTITQTGTVFGTATYLSPEQARGDPVDARSDLYSLSVVLHEALTGAPPFTGDSAMAVAYKHLEEDPPPPSSVNARVPEDLDRVVLHGMEKDPEARYQTADELREDLDRFRRGEPVLVGAGPAATPTQPLDARSTSVMPAVGTPGDGAAAGEAAGGAGGGDVPGDGEEAAPWTPPRRRVRRPDRGVVVAAVALGTVLLIGALVALALSAKDPIRPGAARREARQTTTPPAETTQPPTTDATSVPAPPDPIAAAVFGFEDALQQGLENGEVSEEVAAKLADEVRKALEEVDRGDADKAVGRLDHLESSVWKLYDQGHITSEERAAILADAVAGIRDAIVGAEPSLQDGGGSSGDKGKGDDHGHDGEKDEGDD